MYNVVLIIAMFLVVLLPFLLDFLLSVREFAARTFRVEGE